MAGFVHRQGDNRACGASTLTQISNVRVNGKAISVEGDTCSHGKGSLSATVTSGKVRAGGKSVIINGDPAKPDGLCPPVPSKHCSPKATGASPNVRAGGG